MLRIINPVVSYITHPFLGVSCIMKPYINTHHRFVAIRRCTVKAINRWGRGLLDLARLRLGFAAGIPGMPAAEVNVDGLMLMG